MSEKSPWGQAPPPGYGPLSGGTSGTSGGGYPPPPAQGPPGGPPAGWSPPPPKRNTAAIVAIVVGVLVVIAAVVVTLVVITSDDDVDQAKVDTAPASSESTSATPPTSDTQTSDTPAGGSDVPNEAVIGDGYYFELPGIGWQDALDEARTSGLGTTLDSIIILGSSLDLAQSNILVEALTAGGAPDLESLEEQWKRNLSGVDGAVPDDLPDITIDGERAIGVRFTDRENVNGLLIDQVVYLALHEGNQFSVALSLPSEDDAVSEADFEKVLASWTWTD